MYFALGTCSASFQKSSTLRRPIVAEHNPEHEILFICKLTKGMGMEASDNFHTIVVSEKDIHTMFTEWIDAIANLAYPQTMLHEGTLGTIHRMEYETSESLVILINMVTENLEIAAHGHFI